jgi:hypothetical protein
VTIQHEHAVKFDSTQVGSPQHLKDRYASGYELVAYLESADREPALGAYLHETLERAGCGCALAGLAAGVATYELQGERPLKHAFACLEDADARARLGVRSFRVDRASMEKVFIRIVGEGGDEDLDTDATNAMGRSVAQALQDDQEEDLELARDLAAVGFDEPRDCCGILTRFGHASLARYSCAMRFTVHKSISRLAHRRTPTYWLICAQVLRHLRLLVHGPLHPGHHSVAILLLVLRAVVRLWRLALGLLLCGNQNFTARSAESSRRPPRHRRGACSMAWRCRFLTARRSQHGRVIAAK